MLLRALPIPVKTAMSTSGATPPLVTGVAVPEALGGKLADHLEHEHAEIAQVRADGAVDRSNLLAGLLDECNGRGG